MVQVLTEGVHKGECLFSEANGYRSRERLVLEAGFSVSDGEPLETVADKVRPWDGTGTITGVAYGNYEAATDDVEIVGIVRDAEVKRAVVETYESTAVDIDVVEAGLLLLGIVLR